MSNHHIGGMKSMRARHFARCNKARCFDAGKYELQIVWVYFNPQVNST